MVWIGSSKSKSGGEERRKMSRTEKKGKRRSKGKKGKENEVIHQRKRKEKEFSPIFFSKKLFMPIKERKKKSVCLFVFLLLEQHEIIYKYNI